MKKVPVVVKWLALVAVVAAASLLAVERSSGTGSPPSSLQTALVDPDAFSSTDSEQTFKEVGDTGATVVRLILYWQAVAPATVPPDFAASDPEDPAYNWQGFDAEVRAATAEGLKPIVDITGAPPWATAQQSRGGPYKPSPTKLAAFAKAAARRYGGQVDNLPRVRYWQLWNEPNLAVSLRPQFVGSTLYSPIWYRTMLNAFAASVHSVHSDNLVVAGGTAPFTSRAGKRASWGPGPLLFLRTMLCLSKQLKPTCSQKAHFDVWSTHPYTAGGPSHHANIPDDVSLADLPRMKAVLDAGVSTGHIVSHGKPRFWVTEFSWDTNPPDPNAMPIALQTRWVSEALYTMWKAGVSLVTWFLVKDQPLATSPYQSGLYFRGGKPKPSLRAFRFPFVAFSKAGAIDVWGRTPSSKPGTVVVEQASGGAWKRLGSLKSNSSGIFSGSYRSNAKTSLRARLVGSTADSSQPYSLIEPPDKSYRPFGEQK
jgi:hypothetical protein